jgi:hypothetical protein
MHGTNIKPETLLSTWAAVVNDVLKVSKHNWKQKHDVNLHEKCVLQFMNSDSSHFLAYLCSKRDMLSILYNLPRQ